MTILSKKSQLLSCRFLASWIDFLTEVRRCRAKQWSRNLTANGWPPRKTQALGKTPVYFISLKPSKLRFAQLSLQNQVNAAIRARAGKRSHLHYIDVVSPMLENGKPKDLFGPDGLHMTAAGYVIWTRGVRAALLPNTEAEAHSCRLTVAQPSAVKPTSRQ